MSRIYTFLSCLLFMVMGMAAVGCADSGEEPDVNPVVPEVIPEVTGRTVLVYMAVADLGRYASEDIAEMEEVVSKMQTNDNHFLVYCDDNRGVPTLRLLMNDNGKPEYQTLKTYSEGRNSCGRDETAEVFRDAFGVFPEDDSYGLVYWSHADGWIPGSSSTRWIGYDGGNTMSIDDFAWALEHAPHLDFMLFDACFMQSIEATYALCDYTDYFIGSPTETPGTGGPYQVLVPAFFSKSPGLEIPGAYFSHYRKHFDNTLSEGWANVVDADGNWIGGVSMTSVDSGKLRALAAQTKSALEGVDASDLYSLRRTVFNYDKRKSSAVGYYDMQDLMQTILPSDVFAEWKQAFGDAKVYWNTTPFNYSAFAGLFPMEEGGANGVSCYIPQSPTGVLASYYHRTAWYRDAGFEALGW